MSIQKQAENLIQKKLEEQHEKEIEIKIRIITSGYDRAIAYTNIIIFAGYAGTFTIWSFTKDFLPETASILTALMLGVSLFVFCGWEVFKMIHTSLNLNELSKIMLQGLSPGKFEQAIQQAEMKIRIKQLRLHQYWILILCVTITLGFGGAIILFYNFLANLFNWPYWPT